MIYTKKFGLVALLGTSILADQVFALEDTAMTRAVVLRQSDTADDGTRSSTRTPGAGDATLRGEPDKENSTAQALKEGVKSISSALAESKRGDGKRSDSPVKQKPEDKRSGSPVRQKPEEDKRSDIRKIVDDLLKVITSTEGKPVSTGLVVRNPQTTGSLDRSLQLWDTLAARSSNKAGLAEVHRKVKLLEDVELSQLRLERTRRIAKEKTAADEGFSKVKGMAAQKVAQGELFESKGQDKAHVPASNSTWEAELLREIDSIEARASVWKFLLEMELDLAKRTASHNAELFNKELASAENELLKFSQELANEREAAEKNARLPYDDSRGMHSGRAEFALRDMGVESFFTRDYKLPLEIENAVREEILRAKKAIGELCAAEENDKNAKWQAILAMREQSEKIQVAAREADLAKERVKIWKAAVAKAAAASRIVVVAWETLLIDINARAQLEDEAEDAEASGRVACDLAATLEQAIPTTILKLEQETQLLARALGATASASAESKKSKAELFQSRIRAKDKESIRDIPTAVIEAARAEYARKRALIDAKRAIATLLAAENAESPTWQEILRKVESTKEEVRRAELHRREKQEATQRALDALKTAILATELASKAAKAKAIEAPVSQQQGTGSTGAGAGAAESKGEESKRF